MKNRKALKIAEKNDDIKQLLRVAHHRSIVTEWPPFLTREKINKACLEYGADG